MKNKTYTADLVVVLASAAWGLFWIPLRAFERQGLEPGWATLSQFVAPLLVLLPFALWRWFRHGKPTGIRHIRVGLFVGTAIALYMESLLLTGVARALILFYAMPAWGTLLEITVMKRPLTRRRALSLLLSAGGLLIILDVGRFFLSTINVGDVMALLSGMCFAVGALQVRQVQDEIPVFEQLFAFFFYASLVALALSQLPLDVLGEPPQMAQLLVLIPVFLLVSVGLLIPVMAGIYWGSRRVDPGRLGILLQVEAVVGIGSAAIWAAEPFGLRQAAGAVLVITAGLTEVIGNRPPIQQKSPAD